MGNHHDDGAHSLPACSSSSLPWTEYLAPRPAGSSLAGGLASRNGAFVYACLPVAALVHLRPPLGGLRVTLLGLDAALFLRAPSIGTFPTGARTASWSATRAGSQLLRGADHAYLWPGFVLGLHGLAALWKETAPLCSTRAADPLRRPLVLTANMSPAHRV